MNEKLFIAADMDDAGKQVGRAVLGDNPELLSQVSAKIDGGIQDLLSWVMSVGGRRISSGGDEGTFSIPADKYQDLEKIRQIIKNKSGFNMTIGCGNTLSEAGKALIQGKLSGKNQIVQYSPETDQFLMDAHTRAMGEGATYEERKQDEAYLAPAAEEQAPASESGELPPDEEGEPNDEENTELPEGGDEPNEGSDEQPEEMAAPEGEEATSPEEGGEEGGEEEALEAQSAEEEMPTEQDGEEALSDDSEALPEQDAEMPAVDAEMPDQEEAPPEEGSDEMLPDEGGEELSPEEGSDELPPGEEGYELPPEENSDDLPPEEGEGSDAILDNLTDRDLAAGTGLEEDGEDDQEQPEDKNVASMGSLLRDSLESSNDEAAAPGQGEEAPPADQAGVPADGGHDEIKQMLGEALEGFKANRDFVEKTRQENPGLYASCIKMLRTMVAMARAMGISGGAEAPPEGDVSDEDVAAGQASGDEVADQDGPQAGAQYNDAEGAPPKKA